MVMLDLEAVDFDLMTDKWLDSAIRFAELFRQEFLGATQVYHFRNILISVCLRNRIKTKASASPTPATTAK